MAHNPHEEIQVGGDLVKPSSPESTLPLTPTHLEDLYQGMEALSTAAKSGDAYLVGVARHIAEFKRLAQSVEPERKEEVLGILTRLEEDMAENTLRLEDIEDRLAELKAAWPLREKLN